MELSAESFPPPALEIELGGVPREPCVLGLLITHLREQLATSDYDVPLWYMHSSADESTLRIGFHADLDKQPDLLSRIKAILSQLAEEVVITALPPGTSFQDSSILKRLPYGLLAPLGATLLDSYLIGTDLALTILANNSFSPAPPQELTSIFGQLAEHCFEALNLSMQQRTSYSLFHRDSIVRFIVLRAGKGQEKAGEVLRLLEGRATFMVALDASRPSYPLNDGSIISRHITRWIASVVKSCRIAQDEHSLTSLSDPFTRNRVDIFLFQLFHMMARQLGLSLLGEAEAFTIKGRRAGIQDPQHSVDKFALTSPSFEEEPTALKQPSAPIGHRSPWMLLIESGSAEGKILIKQFNDELGETYNLCTEALLALRQHGLGAMRFERAMKCLDSVRPRIAGTDALTLLLARFFWGSEAYYYYCQGEFTRSEDILRRAGDCLNQAIDSAACLTPCAPLNSDIPLQCARVARRLGDWSRVTRELSLLADFESGRRPLQQRRDGVDVTYQLIEKMCYSNSCITSDDRRIIHDYLDLSCRIPRLNRWIRSFYFQRGIIVEA